MKEIGEAKQTFIMKRQISRAGKGKEKDSGRVSLWVKFREM